MTSKEDRPLTLKQENFCQYYVDIEGNASEATAWLTMLPNEGRKCMD